MKDRPIRVLALAGTLVVLLLSSVLAARPEPALPAEMPASERSRLAAGTATASAATHAGGAPFVARRGQAVVVIEYGVQAAADGKSLISAAVTGFVKLENPLVEMASRLLSRTARAKAEREARQLVKVFARTTRAIEHDPAGVHELLRLRPDVSRPELEAFRQLLRLP